jgi:hypothetical protein
MKEILKMGKDRKVIDYAHTVPELSPEDLKELQPEMMMRLIGTQDRTRKPNIGMVPSMRHAWPDKIAFGEFVIGKTKFNLDQHDPRAGLLFMSLGLELWNAKGKFTRWAYEGEDYEYLNNTHLLRYNAYTGIRRVGYINIEKVVPKRKIPLVKVLEGNILGHIAKGALKRGLREERMSVFTQSLFNALANGKYLCWIGSDGFPEIIPAIQMIASDANRLIFSPLMFQTDLARIPEGAWVACLAVNTKDFTIMQVKGLFKGWQKVRGVKMGVIDVEEVYSSIAPKAGDRIYPPPVAGHLFGIEGMYARQ